MKNYFFLAPIVLAATQVVAATPITYDELLDKSNGDASPRALVGKTVTVAATRFGELGFITAKGKELTFVCKSGDKSLTGAKPKPTTFSGTTVSAQGWDGATIWSLADCQPGLPVAANVTASSSASVASASASIFKIKGDGDATGSPANTSLQTVQGFIFSDRDPGGWYFGLKVDGKKPLRITYAGETVSKALAAYEEKAQPVAVTGFVGTYKGGTRAFDNARDVEIQPLAK